MKRLTLIAAVSSAVASLIISAASAQSLDGDCPASADSIRADLSVAEDGTVTGVKLLDLACFNENTTYQDAASALVESINGNKMDVPDAPYEEWKTTRINVAYQSASQ